ncbi:MAG: ABC transporter permease [Flavobacteriales bacterium]|nr:ABC transporter permease [Flavobacteriales bacterium]
MPATKAAIFGRHLNLPVRQVGGTANVGFAHFIAQRILSAKDRHDRLSRPIVWIAVLGIVIGMAVMIITVAISTGFQDEVRNKLIGAGGHLQITSMQQTDAKETPRISVNQAFYPHLDTLPGVRHIQVYATKPGIIETEEEIQGVMVKGVDADHDWTFLQQHLVAGSVPAITAEKSDSSGHNNEMLLSQWMTERLGIGVGDTITVYLVKGREDIRPRKFNVCGIYRTGLEQLDQQVVFIDIGHLQRFSGWGLQAEISVGDVEDGRFVTITASAFGGDRNYTYEWPGTDLKGPGPHRVQVWDWHNPNWRPEQFPTEPKDTSFTLVVHDNSGTIPDTSTVRIVPDLSIPITHSLGTDWVVQRARVERSHVGSTHEQYVGGFEVALESYNDLIAMDDVIYQDHLGYGMRTVTVRQRSPEMFAWLELLDTNVWVVIVLMTIVAIINMTSALIIIILERTAMIGVLKSLGSPNGVIRRIFLIDAAYILGIGILLGDLLGVGLCFLQRWTGLATLNMDVYYVHAVPVMIDPLPIVALNAGVLLVCLAALVLPSMLVTRIPPVRAIRFA